MDLVSGERSFGQCLGFSTLNSSPKDSNASPEKFTRGVASSKIRVAALEAVVEQHGEEAAVVEGAAAPSSPSVRGLRAARSDAPCTFSSKHSGSPSPNTSVLLAAGSLLSPLSIGLRG